MSGKLAVPSIIATPGVVDDTVAVTPVSVCVPSLANVNLNWTFSPASQYVFAWPTPPVAHVSATREDDRKIACGPQFGVA
jgi:hypothetical protein